MAFTAPLSTLQSTRSRGRALQLRKVIARVLFALAVVPLLMQTGGQAVEPDALPYSKGFLVTGNYVVGGLDLTPQQNPAVDGFATGEIHIGNVPPQGNNPGNVVPPNADIVAAFLYWEAIHQAGPFDPVTNPSPAAGVKFRGMPISPTAIKGSSFPLMGNLATCWGAAGGSGSEVTMLRADVLHLLPKQFDANNKWTGKYAVNDADLTTAQDENGVLYGPHTVTLPEITGDQATQSAGATLFLVYRNPSEPLRKIVVFDGVYHKPQGGTMSQTLRGFYKTAGGSARLTHVVGNGGNNQTEVVRFNGSIIPNLVDAFPQTSPSSDRSWANPTREVTMPTGLNPNPNGYGEEVTTTVTNTSNNPNDCQAWAAVFFSTEVADVDHDGIPDGVEDSQSGLSDPPTASSPTGDLLPNLNAMGAFSDRKDVFIEVNAMLAEPGESYGSLSAPFSPTQAVASDVDGHTHVPSPEVLKMVGDAYNFAPVDGGAGIRVHFDVGDPDDYRDAYLQEVCPNSPCTVDATVADQYLVSFDARGGELITEQACTVDPQDTAKCQFPAYPGTVGWKVGLQLLRDAPVADDGTELTAAEIQATWNTDTANTGDHRRRFDHIRKDFFHYLLYAHARGTPRSEFPCLVAVPQTNPPVLTPGTFDANNGTSCTTDNPDFHAPRSVSGIADLPGGNAMITLGLWDNFVGTPYVQAATTLHELGHNFNLWHGGLPAVLGNKSLNTATYVEPNCKPNHVSSMSYLYQVFGLFDPSDNIHVDYSRASHGDSSDVNGKFINETTTLTDGPLSPPTPLYLPAWYAPANSLLATELGGPPATRYCGGERFDPWSSRKAISVGNLVRPSVSTGLIYQATVAGITATNEPTWPAALNGTVVDGTVTWKAVVPVMARVTGPVGTFAFDTIDWNGDKVLNTSSFSDANFDGNPSPYTGILRGFSDWDNIRLDQIRAGRNAVKYSDGDFADFGSGDFVDFGSGDFLDFGSGDFLDFGSGDFADFGSGDFLDFGSGDFMDFGSGDFMDFGSGDFADFGSGDFMDFGSGDFVDFGSGDFTDFGSGPESQELDYNAARGLGRGAPFGLKACLISLDPGCKVVPKNNPEYGKVELRWQAPTFGRVAQYRIERKRTTATAPFVQIGTSLATIFVDLQNLNPDVQYTYRVRAVFDDQTPNVLSGWSKTVTITIRRK